ncbi:MAG: hypothetical protein JF619_25105 [Massilia sp.]|nr:hypothetical protein [Massilia sp.]
MDNEHRIAAVEAGLEAVKGELSVVKASFATRDALAHVSDRVTVLESTSIIPREFHEMSRKVAVIESNYVTRAYLDEKIEVVYDPIDRLSAEIQGLTHRVANIESSYATKHDIEVAIRGLTWRMYGVVTASIVANYVISRLLLS